MIATFSSDFDDLGGLHSYPEEHPYAGGSPVGLSTHYVPYSLLVCSLSIDNMSLTGQINLKSFLGRRHFQIPESSFTFLFFFDLTSYIERKNPFAVFEAFDRVCSLRPGSDLCLVIKLKGGEMKAAHQDIFSDYVARLKGRLVII